MAYDPIERWEWEGGALALELDVPLEATRDASASPPQERARHDDDALRANHRHGARSPQGRGARPASRAS